MPKNPAASKIEQDVAIEDDLVSVLTLALLYSNRPRRRRRRRRRPRRRRKRRRSSDHGGGGGGGGGGETPFTT
jgi:hypothetical protein